MTEKLLTNNDIKIKIEDNLKSIQEKIYNAALKSGRNPNDITLLAATKTVPSNIVNYAISLGINNIGENKVQELLIKHSELALDYCSLHMIGHLQTNKVKKIIGKVKLIQSVDSLKLASEISKISLQNNVVTNVLIEVNIGKESKKSGVFPENLLELLEKISEFRAIKVKGLMAIPPIYEKSSQKRLCFSNMNKLFVDIKEKKIDNISMDILSIGMSDDYVEAILEGSTMVRIGSALFGKRK